MSILLLQTDCKNNLVKHTSHLRVKLKMHAQKVKLQWFFTGNYGKPSVT